jgi:hypothetical protein
MGVSPVEFQALPGPEVGALRGKTIRLGSFLGPGGQLKGGMQNGKLQKRRKEFRLPNWSAPNKPAFSC